MQLKIEGIQDHKGFLLNKAAILSGKVHVLTGRNGSGKTRLIESLQNQYSTVSIDNVIISAQDVTLVQQNTLNPNFGSHYNDAQYQARITATLQLYDIIKDDLNHPFDHNKVMAYNRRQENGLDYKSLFKLCLSISSMLDKLASELTHDDIILHFEEPSANILGMQNLSTVFNQYIKRLNQNQHNEWLRTIKNKDVPFWSEAEFFDHFGVRPWIIANRILQNTFDGKFKFSTPDENSLSYTYQTQLIQTDNDQVVSVEHLSSGEKTLLWLALTLFNSQYYNAEIAHTSKLLLLDEPDAFLYPKMVLKMYQALEAFEQNFNSIVIITTHSPTTVALAPNDVVFLVENNNILVVEKDSAISELLDGVTQISLNPKNRRQVFVESQYDANVYQAIFSSLIHKSILIDPKISLSFVSSGPKMPRQQLIDKAKQIFGIKDEMLLNEFVEAVNGVGDCSKVIGQVEALVEKETVSVRGIIDWDTKNCPSPHISILAQNYAYSIENVTLDPICILLLLHIEKPNYFTMSEICGAEIHWSNWLTTLPLLQEAVDRFILKVLERPNSKRSKLKYISGIELLTDQEYLTMDGHKLESLVKQKYQGLNAYCKKGKDGELKYSIVTKSMINLTKGDFIPYVYELVLSEVQR